MQDAGDDEPKEIRLRGTFLEFCPRQSGSEHTTPRSSSCPPKFPAEKERTEGSQEEDHEYLSSFFTRLSMSATSSFKNQTNLGGEKDQESEDEGATEQKTEVKEEGGEEAREGGRERGGKGEGGERANAEFCASAALASSTPSRLGLPPEQSSGASSSSRPPERSSGSQQQPQLDQTALERTDEQVVEEKTHSGRRRPPKWKRRKNDLHRASSNSSASGTPPV
mmetsp:Transcript_68724/g.122431  ORF Transcript_68724/g.122431 Transcript_68724/m.122431 type:complete len:223 (+) Transcript_68724:78-746(+)